MLRFNSLLIAFCCAGFLLLGCSDDPDLATAPAAKNMEPLDLFAKAAAPTKRAPVDLKEGTPLVDWPFSAQNAALPADGKVVFLGQIQLGQGDRAIGLQGIDIATKNKKYDWPLSGPCLELLAVAANGSAVAFSRDPQKAPGLIEVWDTAKGTKRTQFQHPLDRSSFGNQVTALALSPDGKTGVSVINATLTGKAYTAWSTETGKQLWAVPIKYFTSNLRFTRDGQLVLGWHEQGPALFDAKTGELREHYKTTARGSYCWLEMTADEKHILVHLSDKADDNRQSYFGMIERATGNLVYSVRPGGKEAGKIAVLPDGQHVMLMHNLEKERILQIHQVSDGALKASFRINSSSNRNDGLVFPNGKTFLLRTNLYDIPSWQ